MILSEFMAELGKVAGEFEWRFAQGGRIAGTRTVGPRKESFDPVTAVCFEKTGRICEFGDGLKASGDIGLSDIDYGDVMAASNNVWARTRAPDRYGQAVRRNLIETLGLPFRTRLPWIQGALWTLRTRRFPG